MYIKISFNDSLLFNDIIKFSFIYIMLQYRTTKKGEKMNTDGNLEALNRYEREQDKAEKILEHEQNELYKDIEPYIDGLNSAMRYFAHGSVLDKQEILEYVKETLENLLEIK